MSDFINTTDILGDDAVCDAIITKSITEYADDDILSIGDYSFYSSARLTKIDLPNVTEIGVFTFYGCSALQTANLPVATSIGNYAFYANSKLGSVNVTSVTQIGKMAFRNCSQLTVIDLPSVSSIDTYVFYNCTNLKTVIIRNQTMCELVNTNAFGGMPISNGTGYIYVPSALVDTYRAGTNWSALANQIRAIEDYPDITGG